MRDRLATGARKTARVEDKGTTVKILVAVLEIWGGGGMLIMC